MDSLKSVSNKASDVDKKGYEGINGANQSPKIVGSANDGIKHNPAAQSDKPNKFGVKSLSFRRVNSGY
jgi:hypothetical protein